MARKRRPKICEWCRCEFMAERPRNKYCSIRCLRFADWSNRRKMPPDTAKAIDDAELRFWMNVKSSRDSCWEWHGIINRYGYGQLKCSKRKVLAHRFSWTIHSSEIPRGLCVCHKCDNPICVRPDHLFLGTHADNRADCVSKGRHRPSRETHKKLTPESVLAIRERYASGEVSMSDLAMEYGVRPPAISSVVRRKTWARV